jgi:hypothetical protein
MKKITIQQQVDSSMALTAYLRACGCPVLSVACPTPPGGIIEILMDDGYDEQVIRDTVATFKDAHFELECDSPKIGIGCRTVKADGLMVHTVRVFKKGSNGQLLTDSDEVLVVPTSPVPISNYILTLANGEASFTVGPTVQPLLLTVHIVDRTMKTRKRGMELCFLP